ncbi:MAG: hypothetical protein IT424_14320 [Pirellulales bacterium]|nr:hypothetical protein [Pirellulales bacterium]
MAIVNRTSSAVVAPHGEAATIAARTAPPQLLRCLVVCMSAQRRRLIRAAAEAQAWDAIICRDAGEFLRVAFKRTVPLVVVDLPAECSAEYWELRQATRSASQACRSLFFVTGTSADPAEEIWARGMGVWAYVNDLCGQRGFELVLSEARHVVSRDCSLTPAFPDAYEFPAADGSEGDW